MNDFFFNSSPGEQTGWEGEKWIYLPVDKTKKWSFEQGRTRYKHTRQHTRVVGSVLFWSHHKLRPQGLRGFGTRKYWLWFDVIYCTHAFKLNNNFRTRLEGSQSLGTRVFHLLTTAYLYVGFSDFLPNQIACSHTSISLRDFIIAPLWNRLTEHWENQT